MGLSRAAGQRAEPVAHSPAEILRHGDEVAQHRAGSREAACTAPVQHQVLHGFALEEYGVEGVAHRGQRVIEGDHRRMHAHSDLAVLPLGHGEQLDHMPHPGGGGDVVRADRADAFLVDISCHDFGAEGRHGQDRRLGPRIESLHIGSRIGFGVAQSLCLAQYVGVVSPVLGHAGEDVVRRAVHDAHHPGDALADERVAQNADERDPAGHGCFEGQVDAVGSGQCEELLADVGDQFLVGGHDGLAGVERGGDQMAGRLDAAHRLDDHVYVLRDHQRLAVACQDTVGNCD